MNTLSEIEIRAIPSLDKEHLSLGSCDKQEIMNLFNSIESLLNPAQNPADESDSYSINNGRIRKIFKTSLEGASTFLDELILINQTTSIGGVEKSTATIVETLQKSALKNGFTYEFRVPSNDNPYLIISQQRAYFINEDIWADGEFYFYGKVVMEGSQDKNNLHLQTKEYGLITIHISTSTDQDSLQALENYSPSEQFGVRVKGRQNIKSGQIDMSRLHLLELTPYNPAYDEEYLEALIKQAAPFWKDIEDPDRWLLEIRGTNVED